MPNMLHTKVTIRGTKPLLWHTFGPDSIPLEKQERAGVAGHDPQEWRKTYTATAEGQLYLDPGCVFGAIRDGARHIKKGRSSIQSDVVSTLQVLEERVLTDRYMPTSGGDPDRDPSKPVFLDVRGVVNPGTKARGIRYRVAASAGWQMSFTLLWDKTVVSRQQMEAALRDAGMLEGLGDGRRMGFGRFVVERFEVCDAT